MMKDDPKRAKKLADEIIRNTYRTLMTRGQKGCYVYCTDPALADYLRQRYEQSNTVYEENEFFKPELRVSEDKEEYK